jgi:hypothetical protein
MASTTCKSYQRRVKICEYTTDLLQHIGLFKTCFQHCGQKISKFVRKESRSWGGGGWYYSLLKLDHRNRYGEIEK